MQKSCFYTTTSKKFSTALRLSLTVSKVHLAWALSQQKEKTSPGPDRQSSPPFLYGSHGLKKPKLRSPPNPSCIDHTAQRSPNYEAHQIQPDRVKEGLATAPTRSATLTGTTQPFSTRSPKTSGETTPPMALAAARSGLRSLAARAAPARRRMSSSVHDDAYETAKWEKITYAGIVTCTLLAAYNLSKGHPHFDEPPAYPYLHIRNKEFPWGPDGLFETKDHH